ncbi:unnamed protein product, partial [Closterium sp. NIES-53]
MALLGPSNRGAPAGPSFSVNAEQAGSSSSSNGGRSGEGQGGRGGAEGGAGVDVWWSEGRMDIGSWQTVADPGSWHLLLSHPASSAARSGPGNGSTVSNSSSIGVNDSTSVGSGSSGGSGSGGREGGGGGWWASLWGGSWTHGQQGGAADEGEGGGEVCVSIQWKAATCFPRLTGPQCQWPLIPLEVRREGWVAVGGGGKTGGRGGSERWGERWGKREVDESQCMRLTFTTTCTSTILIIYAPSPTSLFPPTAVFVPSCPPPFPTTPSKRFLPPSPTLPPPSPSLFPHDRAPSLEPHLLSMQPTCLCLYPPSPSINTSPPSSRPCLPPPIPPTAPAFLDIRVGPRCSLPAANPSTCTFPPHSPPHPPQPHLLSWTYESGLDTAYLPPASPTPPSLWASWFPVPLAASPSPARPSWAFLSLAPPFGARGGVLSIHLRLLPLRRGGGAQGDGEGQGGEGESGATGESGGDGNSSSSSAAAASARPSAPRAFVYLLVRAGGLPSLTRFDASAVAPATDMAARGGQLSLELIHPAEVTTFVAVGLDAALSREEGEGGREGEEEGEGAEGREGEWEWEWEWEVRVVQHGCPNGCSGSPCHVMADGAFQFGVYYCFCDRSHGGVDCSIETVSQLGIEQQRWALVGSNVVAVLPAMVSLYLG